MATDENKTKKGILTRSERRKLKTNDKKRRKTEPDPDPDPKIKSEESSTIEDDKEEDPSFIVEDEDEDEEEDDETVDDEGKSFNTIVNDIRMILSGNRKRQRSGGDVLFMIPTMNSGMKLGNSEDDTTAVPSYVKGDQRSVEQWNKLQKSEKDKILKSFKKIHDEKNSSIYPSVIDIIKSEYIPNSVKLRIIEKITEYNRRVSSGQHGEDTEKLGSWIRQFNRIPFGKYIQMPVLMSNDPIHEVRHFMQDAENQLDEVIFGQDEAKKEIMNTILQMVSNPKSNGKILTLQGPPGNGKTSLVCKGVAKILKRPFIMLSMGGMNDTHSLTGHSSTYVGSQCGQIVQGLIDNECMNPVIFLDEIDKVRDEEIIGILTHMLDLSQNSRFFDRYFNNIPIDLSRCIIICSCNDETKIDPILKDRMHIVKTDPLSKENKVEIIRKFAIDENISRLGLAKGSILISLETIRHVVMTYDEDNGGVRNIKTIFERIFNFIHKRIVMSKKDGTSLDQLRSYPCQITQEQMELICRNILNKDRKTGIEMMYI